ncbi:hypothetical protein [uncultured Kordia sp.]|uniref:zinc-ribbon domain-containing protein n=1 Tax=uncultured Kordia sp. TaxID=507699 RepID=UPI00262CD5B9|nr:hypothetical protein [uncultured Kordia sp.]
MRNCISCYQQITDDVNFCPHCGAKQSQLHTQEEVRATHQETENKPVVIIIVLAILTICGSIFTIGRAVLYELVGSMANDDGIMIRAGIYVFASIGTIAGAIMMLLKKMNGLYLYTVCQIIYIIAATFAAIAHNSKENLASVIFVFFVAPSILFLIFYWIKDVRKHLK